MNASKSPGEEFIIYEKEGRAGLPADLVRLSNGDLVSAFREAANHMDEAGNIAWMRSTDLGRTWDNYRVIRPVNEEPCDFRDPSITELSDGTLLCTFFIYVGHSHGHLGKLEDGFKRNNERSGVRIVVMRSFDGGETWPEEREVLPDMLDWILTTERCVELPSGRVLMPIFAGTKDKLCEISGCLYSDDKGASWEFLSAAMALPWTSHCGFSMEMALTRTQSGKLVAVSRSRGNMFQAVSEDDGARWRTQTEIKNTRPCTQPSLNTLQDSRLLLMYGDRDFFPRTAEYPLNIAARLSEDEGETWGKPFAVRTDVPHWDMGYPTSVEIEPGRMLTVYWLSETVNDQKWPHSQRYRTVCRDWRVPG